MENICLPHSITLEEPIVIGNSEPITTITITRKPKMKDLENLPDTMSNVDKSVKIVSRVTGLVSAVVSEMSPVDFNKVNEIIAHFLPKSQETGVN